MTPTQICDEIKRLHYKRICLTGGEPLLQKEIGQLLEKLKGYIITIETNGSIPLNSIKLGSGHSFVMDMKTPSSGCCNQMHFANFNYLKDTDEIKFVIGSREDYEWARRIIGDYQKKGAITFSPVFGKIIYKDIVNWILEDKLDVRFQIQLHKIIWEPDMRGV